MKFITRTVTVTEVVFGKFDKNTNTVTEQETRTLAGRIGPRQLQKLSTIVGKMILSTELKQLELRLPLSNFIDAAIAYAATTGDNDINSNEEE